MSEPQRRVVLDPDAMDLLLEVLEGPRAELTAAAAANSAGGARLLASGLLARIGDQPVAAAHDDHEDAPVSVSLMEDGAAPGYYSPSAGLVRVEHDQLAVYRADVPAILASLCRGLGMVRGARPADRGDGLVWEIGPAKLPHRRHRPILWFARRTWHRAGLGALEQAVSRRPHIETRILLSSALPARTAAPNVPGFVVVPIRDALVAPGELRIDPAALAARLATPATPTVRRERYSLSADGRLLTIDGRETFTFRPGEAKDAVAKLIKAHSGGRRLPIGEIAAHGSMRRLFGERWTRLKAYVTSIDGLWGFVE